MFQALLSSWTLALVAPALILALVIAVEHVGPREPVTLRSRVLGFTCHMLDVFLSAALSYGIIVLWQSYVAGPLIRVPLDGLLSFLGPGAVPAAVVVLVLLADFLRYWRHRLEHRAFWSIHLTHHSVRELHAASGVEHPLQAIPDFLVITLPLTLFAFDGPTVPVAVNLLVGFSGYFIHSPVEFHLGPLRRVFADNRFHRIHHSLEERHFDKNFGIVFTLWDQLFGTAYFPKEDEWPPVGVEGVEPPRSVGQFLMYPLRATAPSSRRRIEERRHLLRR